MLKNQSLSSIGGGNSNVSVPPITNTSFQVNQLLNDLNKNSQKPADLNDLKKENEKVFRSFGKYKNDALSISNNETTIVGKTIQTYEVDTQCNLDKDIQQDSDEDKEVSNNIRTHKKSIGKANSKAVTSSIKKNEIPNNTFNYEDTKIDYKEDHQNNITKTIKIVPSEETRRQILNSTELSEFLTTKSKLVERALGEKDIFDMFKTYYDEGDNEDNDKSKRSWVSNAVEFIDDASNGRTVVNLDWSYKHQELLLASYSKADDFNLNQSNGLINLWSLALRKTPEFTFTCQTEITAAILHKFDPKLIIGATYTGQILIWDTRGKSLPKQKTPPGGKFHSHPIHCLGITGTTNANNIISVSSDGTLCTWSMSNLSKPTKQLNLKAKKKKETDIYSSSTSNLSNVKSTEEIGAICMATQDNEINNIFIGSDDSDIYQIYVHQGNDTMDNVVETYRKHNGPIHSLDLHPGDYHKNVNVI